MRNPCSRVVVRYPKAGLRVRNCQTTVRQTPEEIGPVKSFNDWQIYLRFVTDVRYNATFAMDTILSTEMLLADAQEILLKPLNK